MCTHIAQVVQEPPDDDLFYACICTYACAHTSLRSLRSLTTTTSSSCCTMHMYAYVPMHTHIYVQVAQEPDDDDLFVVLHNTGANPPLKSGEISLAKARALPSDDDNSTALHFVLSYDDNGEPLLPLGTVDEIEVERRWHTYICIRTYTHLHTYPHAAASWYRR